MTDQKAGDEVACCRGCGRLLDGKPYSRGGSAYVPHDNPNARGPRVQAKACHYGGYVCSQSCDVRATLALERTMPGHAGQERLSYEIRQRIERKWSTT